MRRIVCTLAFLVAAASPALAQIKVTTKTIARQTPRLEIEVRYPVTGRPALDRLFADYVQARIKEVGQPGKDETPAAAYSVLAGYSVTRNDARFFSVNFAVEEYSGGAHPIHFQESFHFLMPEGARVYLPELLDGPRAMARLSALAVADLSKRLLKEPDSMTNSDWIKSGAAPAFLAQVPFDWTPKELVFYFNEYAVAPYAAGSQEVHIPMAALAGLVRPDPRAPAPSFDCRKAAIAVEKSVCADAALARLDRQVGEAYGRQRVSEADDKAKSDQLQAQRNWLTARDKACGGGDAACLTRSYRQRLAALTPHSP